MRIMMRMYGMAPGANFEFLVLNFEWSWDQCQQCVRGLLMKCWVSLYKLQS
jgi:hypothetical protein